MRLMSMSRPVARAAAIACALALVVLSGLGASDAETVYVEGYPELRGSSGRTSDLFFGDLVRSGESVLTGLDDTAELELANGNSVVVDSDTVFTLQESVEDGETRSAYSNSRGSVTYRLNNIRGRGPRIQSANAVAGVRGTTFTVFAGDDGTSLFLVEEGRVAVQAQGEEVEVNENFAVEVGAGQAPGEPFEVLSGEIDFSGWNNGRTEAILDDPVTAAEGAYRRLEEIVAELNEAAAIYEPLREELRQAREEADEVFDEEGQEAYEEFHAENVRPLEYSTPRRFTNVRYWALSALNMRRYVFGRMYTILRSTYMLDPENDQLQDYLEVHNRAIDLLEREVSEYLGSPDY